MTQTIYKCDLCKQQFERKDIHSIRMEFAAGGGYSNKNFKSIDICTKDAVKIGFVQQVIKNGEIAIQEMPVQDKLFNLIVEIVQNYQIPYTEYRGEE